MAKRGQRKLFDYRRPTPLRAIRRFCLDCTGGRKEEVVFCPVEVCPLHALRHGCVPPDRPTRLAHVRAKCLECAGSPEAVSACSMRKCALHPYREGVEPPAPKRRGAPKVPIQEALAAKRTGTQPPAPPAATEPQPQLELFPS